MSQETPKAAPAEKKLSPVDDPHDSIAEGDIAAWTQKPNAGVDDPHDSIDGEKWAPAQTTQATGETPKEPAVETSPAAKPLAVTPEDTAAHVAGLRDSGKEKEATSIEKSAAEKAASAGAAMIAAKEKQAQEKLSPGLFGRLKNLGERYNKLNWKTKVAIGGTIMLIGFATAGTGIAAASTAALVAGRTLSGLGMLATTDGILSKAGVKNDFLRGALSGGAAVTYALLVPSLFKDADEYFGGALSNKLGEAAVWAGEQSSSARAALASAFGETANTTNVGLPEGGFPDLDTHNPQMNRLGIEPAGENISTEIGDLDAQNPQPNRLGIETADGVQENVSGNSGTKALFSEPVKVQAGQNLWKIIEAKLAETPGFANMDSAGKTWWIDHYKDQFATLSPEQIKELGISSGDINKLKAGEVLNLSLLDTPNLYENAAISAGGLSPEAQASINSNNAKIAEFARANPEVMLTEQRVDSIIRNEALPTAETNPQVGLSEAPEGSGGNGDTSIPQGGPEFQRTVAEYRNEIAQDLFGKKGFFGLGSVDGVDKFNTFVSWRSASEFVGSTNIDATEMGISQTEASKLRDFLTLSVQQYNIQYQGKSVGAVLNDIALAQGTAVLA